MAADIVTMADLRNDAKLITPARMVELAARDIADGTLPATKAIVITLDDADEGHDAHYRNSGMSCSEIVALLEIGPVRIRA